MYYFLLTMQCSKKSKMAKHKLMSQQTIVVVNSNKGKTYDKCKTQIRKKKNTKRPTQSKIYQNIYGKTSKNFRQGNKKSMNLINQPHQPKNLNLKWRNSKSLQKELMVIGKFKKLLFTMENATAADSSQSNISRVYI